MGLEDLSLILIQVLLSQVLASYAQYIQYAGAPIPVPAYVTSYPVSSYAPSPTPIYQAYAQPVPLPIQAPTLGASIAPTTPTHVPIPTNPTPVFQPTAYQTSPYQQPIKATSVTSSIPEPILPTTIPFSCIQEASSKSSSPKDLLPTSPPFDSNVLNNLAIALQLLIVSNLLHNPPPDHPLPQVLDEDILPTVAPLPIAFIPPSIPEPSYPHQHMPNANFIGTTSFGDVGISKSMMGGYGSPTLPSPRPAGLMSPYDAIGPNSPYFEQFQAKTEPKSPYHLTSDYKDLFSLTELFKI